MVRPFRYYKELEMQQRRKDAFERLDMKLEKMIEDMDRKTSIDLEAKMEAIFGNAKTEKDDMTKIVREKLDELKRNNTKRSVTRKYDSIDDIVIKRHRSILGMIMTICFPLIILFLLIIFSSFLSTIEDAKSIEKQPQTLEETTETKKDLKKL